MRIFVRVHDPAVAPTMLELTRTSRAPAMARDWLSEHAPEAVVGLARTLAVRARPEVVEFLRARKRAGDDLTQALPHLDDVAASKLRELVIDHEDASGTRARARSAPAGASGRPGGAAEEAARLRGRGRAAADRSSAARAASDNDAVACVLHACTQLKPDEAARRCCEAVRRHADAEAFAWGLFEAWLGGRRAGQGQVGDAGARAARRRRHRDQARADDPRLAGGEPARARGARPRRARRDRHRHGADAAQRHRREGQVQGAPAARARGDGRDRRRQGHDQGRARGPDRAHVRARRGRHAARSRSAARRTRSRSVRA